MVRADSSSASSSSGFSASLSRQRAAGQRDGCVQVLPSGLLGGAVIPLHTGRSAAVLDEVTHKFRRRPFRRRTYRNPTRESRFVVSANRSSFRVRTTSVTSTSAGSAEPSNTLPKTEGLGVQQLQPVSTGIATRVRSERCSPPRLAGRTQSVLLFHSSLFCPPKRGGARAIGGLDSFFMDPTKRVLRGDFFAAMNSVAIRFAQMTRGEKRCSRSLRPGSWHRPSNPSGLNPLSARTDGYHGVIGLGEVDMALTIQQLQANLDAVNQALGNPTLRVRFPDGREVTYRSVDELRKGESRD
jgi:hypothetical protein